MTSFLVVSYLNKLRAMRSRLALGALAGSAALSCSSGGLDLDAHVELMADEQVQRAIEYPARVQFWITDSAGSGSNFGAETKTRIICEAPEGEVITKTEVHFYPPGPCDRNNHFYLQTSVNSLAPDDAATACPDAVTTADKAREVAYATELVWEGKEACSREQKQVVLNLEATDSD
jgi:hypothetical protein